MTSQGGENYLSPEEAAAQLGVSRRTVDRYADEGLLQRHRQGMTRRVLFKQSDVDALKERMGTIEPDEETK
jgi:excisionase family DNA binding protein